MRIWVLIGVLALLTSCANKEVATAVTDGPRASITLRDGTTVNGIVVSSTPTEMKVTTDDKTTRSVAVNQIRAIHYEDALAPPAPTAAQPAASQPAAVRPAAPQTPTFHVERRHPPEAAVTTKTNILSVGTEIQVRTDETIDSSKAAEGQTFAAEVAKDVRDADGDLVIPRGANATIVIKSMTKGGRFKGQSDLVLDMKTVSIDGRLYTIDTADLEKLGKQGVGLNKRTAEHAGIGAGVGAIIGAIAGSGKGAAIGAGAGAGAGVLTQVITKGTAIKVPVESLLTFQLDRPLRVAASN